MAQGDDNQNELGPLSEALAPVMTSGANWEDVLASGDPSRYLAAIRSGAPPAQVKAPSLLPATNAPNPVAEAPRAPVVPATVTPSGAPDVSSPISRFNKTALQGGLQATQEAENLSAQRTPVDVNSIEAQRAAAAQPASPTNPTGVPNPKDPLHPEYKPGVGRRIARGVLGAVAGLTQGGIGGAVLGAIDPTAVGGNSYGAPTSKFQRAATVNANTLSSLDQQLTQADTQAKTRDQAIQNKLAVAKQFGDIATAGSKASTAESKSGQQDVNLGKAGLKAVRDDQGNITDIVDDPESSMYKARQAATDLKSAQKEEADATAALREAQNDPNSPAFKLAQQRANTAIANSRAAMTRANAYALNALAGNLGVDTEGNQIAGGVTNAAGAPVGSRFAPTYVKQEGKVAQFNDVGGALDNLEKAAKSMVAKGQQPDNTLVAAALAQPNGTAQQWLQGQVAKSNLTPEQRDYVTNLVAAHENIQALRQSAGGGVSDTQVQRLVEMLPNASSPDLDYILRQTGQIRQTASRLAEGVPQTKGGHSVKNPATPASSSVPPKSIVDAAKVGQYIHGPGGVSYQKKADGLYDGSGKKVEIK